MASDNAIAMAIGIYRKMFESAWDAKLLVASYSVQVFVFKCSIDFLIRNRKYSSKQVRNKHCHEMERKKVGMTIIKMGRDEGRMEWDQFLFCISSQQSLHYVHAH